MRVEDDWWKQPPAAPDGTREMPPWQMYDLKRSGLAQIILLRADGAARRVVLPGPAELAMALPPEYVGGERKVLVPVGESRMVALPNPVPEWEVRTVPTDTRPVLVDDMTVMRAEDCLYLCCPAVGHPSKVNMFDGWIEVNGEPSMSELRRLGEKHLSRFGCVMAV